jgi:signal transduction histidine kinase
LAIDSARKRRAKLLNLIVIIFVLLISFFIQALLENYMDDSGFDGYFSYFVAFLSGVWIYMFLSDTIFESFYRSEERIDRLITNSLHELNTPIATISLNLSMLKKIVDSDKGFRLIGRIDEATSSLKRLYQKMEYRLKKEISSVEKESFSITEVIDNSLKKFEDTKGKIEIDTILDMDVVLKCSKDGFEEVVDNLISNAIKYNKPDGVVYIELKDSLLCIKDSGRGIDTKNLFDVFERYYQDDISNEGLGIGLSIVKEFCDENSIKISIDSRVDVGSSFCLDLSSIIKKAT